MLTSLTEYAMDMVTKKKKKKSEMKRMEINNGDF